MSIVEIAVTVIAVFEVIRCISAAATSIVTIRRLNYMRGEWEKFRDGINLGAQVGAGVGGILGGFIDELMGKASTREARLKEEEAKLNKSRLALLGELERNGFKIQPKDGNKLGALKNIVNFFSIGVKRAQPNPRLDANGQNNFGGQARP